jgi:SOS-response transcriptional repressor LexA
VNSPEPGYDEIGNRNVKHAEAYVFRVRASTDESVSEICVLRAMTIPARLKVLRIRAGLSMAQVARSCGFARASSYQRYEDETKFTRPYLPREIAEKLASCFVGRGSPPIVEADVMALTGVSGVALSTGGKNGRLVEVIAVVEAGAWREAVELSPDEREYFPLPPLPGYERTQVLGLRVRGSSMNQVFPEGSIVYFVRPEEQPPVEGNFVVVARRRGELYETTLKELGRDSRGKQALLPRSSDPRHQSPLYPSKSGAEKVEIIGVVIGKFEMMPRAPVPLRS